MDGGQHVRHTLVRDTHAIQASNLYLAQSSAHYQRQVSWDASIRRMVVGLGVAGPVLVSDYCLLDTALSLLSAAYHHEQPPQRFSLASGSF